MDIIFHIDANSAYLSWEAAERIKNGETLDLRSIPAAVGGDEKKRKGVILAKSLPCAPYKIKTGESIFSATKKCPHLVIVPPNFLLYTAYSQAMYDLLSNYSPMTEIYSIDEIFMDMTMECDSIDHALLVADRIRSHIKETLGFTVCVGVSSNKLLAKMATDLRKPDFTNRLFPSEIDVLWKMPVESLFMVGRQTAKTLHNLGIKTIGELASFDKHILEAHLKSHGHLIWNYANGIDYSKVEARLVAEKSIGNSTTTPRDITNFDDALEVFLRLSEKVGGRIRKRNFYAKVVAISIVTNEFKAYSKQITLPVPIDSTEKIYQETQKLFAALWDLTPLRQLGIQLTKLQETSVEQLSLFGEETLNGENNQKNGIKKEAKNTLDQSIDLIREKYGNNALYRARFLNSTEIPLTTESEDFPSMGSHL